MRDEVIRKMVEKTLDIKKKLDEAGEANGRDQTALLAAAGLMAKDLATFCSKTVDVQTEQYYDWYFQQRD